MALDAVPLRNRQHDLYIKAETTTNTPPTFDTASASVTCYIGDDAIDDTYNFDARPKMADVGQYQNTLADYWRKITFEFDLIGSTTISPAFAAIAPFCGWTISGRTATFNPLADTTLATAALGLREGPRLAVGSGMKGALSISCVAGKAARVKAMFTGNVQPDADAAAVTGTKITAGGPRWANASGLVFGSLPLLCSKFDLDTKAYVQMRASQNEVSGYRSAFIADTTDNGPTLTLDPEANTVALQPIQANMLAATENAWAIQLGSVTNNIVTISGSRAQITSLKRSQRNKMIVDGIGCQLNDLLQIAWS